MAKREIVTLNESTPRLVVPQSGDTYQLVRDVFLTTGKLTSEVADGASAVGFTFDTENAFATGGAKIASFKNNGAETIAFGLEGAIIFPEGENNIDIYVAANTADIDVRTIGIYGQYAYPDAASNLVGGSVNIVAGEGASGSAGLASGGDVNIYGGGGYGTGVAGAVNIAQSGRLGFFNATAVTQQNVPLTTPDAQDIIDALVNLGLVEQSD